MANRTSRPSNSDKKNSHNFKHMKTSKSSVFVNLASMDEALNTIFDNSLKDLKPKPKPENPLPNSDSLKEQEILDLKQKLTVIFLKNIAIFL